MQHKETRSPHKQDVQPLQGAFVCSPRLREIPSKVTPKLWQGIENKMINLTFCTTFVWNIFHSKKNWARYDQKCIFVLR